MKRRMEKLREANWSELLRNYVVRLLEVEERRKKDFEKIRLASTEIDALRELSQLGWRGSEVVIEWRKLRR